MHTKKNIITNYVYDEVNIPVAKILNFVIVMSCIFSVIAPFYVFSLRLYLYHAKVQLKMILPSSAAFSGFHTIHSYYPSRECFRKALISQVSRLKQGKPSSLLKDTTC